MNEARQSIKKNTKNQMIKLHSIDERNKKNNNLQLLLLSFDLPFDDSDR